MTTTAGCALVGRPGPDVVLHPLPRLPELGSVALPAGFVGHVQPTLPYASQNTVHVDSAFFEFGGYDAPGRHRCRAQVTVSRYDPQLATPQAHIRELGTKLGELRLVRHAVGHGVAAAEPDRTGPVDTRIPARAAAGRGCGAPFRPHPRTGRRPVGGRGRLRAARGGGGHRLGGVLDRVTLRRVVTMRRT